MMRASTRSRLAFLGLVLLVFFSAAPARAVVRTWTGAGADDNWTTAANWGGTAPSAGDDLVFPGGTPRLTPNNDFAAGTLFNSIAFNGSSGGYTLTGNAIQLAGGVNASNGAGNAMIQLAITLTASQTFACTIPGVLDRLTIAGPVDLGAFTLTLDSAGGSIINMNGVVSNTGGVNSTNTGIVFIVANMTYTGPTNISAGDFALAGASLSASSLVTVSGGLLQFANNASTGPVNATGGTVACEGGGTSQIGNVTDLTLAAASTLQMGLYSASNYGTINASGNVDVTGSNLLLGFVFVSATNDAFTIINKTSAGPVTGTFAGLPEGGTVVVSGRTYQITYVGGDGNDVVVTDITTGGPTPTPTATPAGVPTATATPAGVPTSTPGGPTPTPGPGPVTPVPTLTGDVLMLLALALAVVAILAIRRSG